MEEAKRFSVSDVQRAGFIKKYDTRAAKIIDGGLLTNDYITIDTYANIFSDEPDAGRLIFPANAPEVRGVRRSNEGETPLIPDDARTSDLDDDTQSINLDLTGSATRPPATPTPRATPKPSRKKASKNKALKTAGTEANAMANARLRDPESQCHMLALRDASKEKYGFSESLTTALLLWIQEDQRNARFWCSIKSLKANFGPDPDGARSMHNFAR
ncbi:hypothetical protein E4U52_000759 [Claviceps spartinae]|nr:hypothetical protein E4U52_000759 [Claviceps spartinae]